jgi:hypothetical protein
VPPLPPIALRVSGKTYALEHNSLNWQKLSLAFHAGGDVASLTIDSSGEVAIGLDNVFRVTEIPGLRPTAMRGHWEGADTFIIEGMSLGNPAESKLEMMFTGDEIRVTLEDVVFGGMKVNLHGTSQD